MFIPESGDIKSSVAVLSFILSSAAKHDVDSESLSSELQQLGLPKGENETGALMKLVFSSNTAELLLCSIIGQDIISHNLTFAFAEHTTGLCKSYEDKHTALQEKLKQSSLRCEYEKA